MVDPECRCCEPPWLFNYQEKSEGHPSIFHVGGYEQNGVAVYDVTADLGEEPPYMKWIREAGNNIGNIMSIQVSNDGEYVAMCGQDGGGGVSVVRRKRTGNLVWEEAEIDKTAAIQYNNNTGGVYLSSITNNNLKYRDVTGNEIWSLNLTSSVGDIYYDEFTNLLYEGHEVRSGGGAHQVTAYDGDTGAVVWTGGIQAAFLPFPAIQFFKVSGSNILYAIYSRSGGAFGLSGIYLMEIDTSNGNVTSETQLFTTIALGTSISVSRITTSGGADRFCFVFSCTGTPASNGIYEFDTTGSQTRFIYSLTDGFSSHKSFVDSVGNILSYGEDTGSNVSYVFKYDSSDTFLWSARIIQSGPSVFQLASMDIDPTDENIFYLGHFVQNSPDLL